MSKWNGGRGNGLNKQDNRGQTAPTADGSVSELERKEDKNAQPEAHITKAEIEEHRGRIAAAVAAKAQKAVEEGLEESFGVMAKTEEKKGAKRWHLTMSVRCTLKPKSSNVSGASSSDTRRKHTNP